jgi:hypothetical protein
MKLALLVNKSKVKMLNSLGSIRGDFSKIKIVELEDGSLLEQTNA